MNLDTPSVDLSNKTFGDLKVIQYRGNEKWFCKCSCGNELIVGTHDLINNTITKCNNHINTEKGLSGKWFNDWYVMEPIPGKRRYYKCKCRCGTIKEVHAYSLTSGRSKSCGHKKLEHEIPSVITDVEFRKTLTELLEINEVSTSFWNKEEKQPVTVTSIYEFIKSIYSDKIELKDNDVIYLPDKKLGIRYCQDYFASTAYKAKTFSQSLTEKYNKQGDRLITIYEYEWSDEDLRNRLKEMLYDTVRADKIAVYARKTEVKPLEKGTAEEFCNRYHLQGWAPATINYGCFDKKSGELLGVMTFGKPRFNHSYDYEIVRLCWKYGYTVIGGAAKLMKHFIEDYKPNSILTYADITKFTGGIYSRIGFKPIEVTSPNYVWVRHHKKPNKSGNPSGYTLEIDILKRYQAQKKKLINSGYGDDIDTEIEIMQGHEFVKVSDCGNLKLELILKEESTDEV